MVCGGVFVKKPKEDEPVKPRQRKHAYEYFNQWDAYDVDGELSKLEGTKAAAAPEAPGVQLFWLPDEWPAAQQLLPGKILRSKTDVTLLVV